MRIMGLQAFIDESDNVEITSPRAYLACGAITISKDLTIIPSVDPEIAIAHLTALALACSNLCGEIRRANSTPDVATAESTTYQDLPAKPSNQ